MPQLCLICRKPVPEYGWNINGPGARVECPRCGTHRLSERLAQYLHEWERNPATHPEITPQKLAAASGAIREYSELGEEPFVQDFDDLLAGIAPPIDPLEAIDRVILHVYRKSRSAAEHLRMDVDRDYPLIYALHPQDLRFVLQKATELRFLEATAGPDEFRLTLEGWRRLRDIRREERHSSQAFVAMWFDPSMASAYSEGIKPALESTGFQPLRIDFAEHNEKIDDRIIAEIRKSGLIVADFTGHRGGVYFEAGFAMGLGIPLIWTCRASEIDKAHFDTRQYNHIVWQDPADLQTRLRNRIEATLPRRRGSDTNG